MRVFVLLLPFVATFFAATAMAQTPPADAGCQNDMQCKGDRVCVQGRCQNPTSAPAPSGVVVVPSAPPNTVIVPQREPDPPRDGWTMAGSVIGIVSAAAVLGLGTAAAATVEEDEDFPSAPLSGTASLLGGVLIPITAIAATSATERGSTALKVVGWISYGLFIINSGVVFANRITDNDAPYVAMIAPMTALGVISSLSFAADAFIARKRTREVADGVAALQLGPVLSGVRGRDGTQAPVLGVGGRF